MRTRSLFILGGALLLIAANAFAGPKEDVAAATAKWGETLGQDDPDKVLALYATDAVLWGTLSPTVRSDRAALRDYFVSAFKILPGLKVSFGEQLIRVYGNTAVNTGYYTFAYTKDGEPKNLPARSSAHGRVEFPVTKFVCRDHSLCPGFDKANPDVGGRPQCLAALLQGFGRKCLSKTPLADKPNAGEAVIACRYDCHVRTA